MADDKAMGSSFTWLDHSDKERRRVLEAVDRFKESDTRDELGLAPIRDGFADHFFPGTTVLMTTSASWPKGRSSGSRATRARYFLFVP